MFELMVTLLRKWRPLEGWLLWIMALSTLLLVPAAAESAGWVSHLGPTLGIIILLGYWAGYGLTRPQAKAEIRAGPAESAAGLPGWLAAIILAGIGVLTVSLVVGLPEAPLAAQPVPWALRLPVRAGMAIVEMAERLAQWARAVRGGGAGQDDAVFRWIIGMAAWAAAAWAGWWLYRRRQPLVALLPVGLLLATNAYYYWNGRFWMPFFLGMMAVVAILLNRYVLERRWQRRGMDYSVDVRTDILLAALGVALVVAASAMLMPRVVLRPTADWFEQLTAAPLATLGEAGSQLFPGLRRTPRSLLAEGGGPGSMPRAYLLGSGPELSQEVVMTISTDETAALAPGETPAPGMGQYWRAVTYDTYDGTGWRNSSVIGAEYRAGEPWFDAGLAWRRPVRQRVALATSGNRTVFAAGEPLAVNRSYDALVRGPSGEPPDDLVALTASGKRYEVVSLVPVAGEQTLREAGSDYPPAVLRRYLQLPDMPSRVAELARSLTAGAATPYDQALALERALRRYPYDLGVMPPPRGQDTVDYFLFDAGKGYCDYYASAMVVLARSLGIPARLATGYATGAYDPEVQAFVVHGADAHSWPELYFPGVGWVPFEPTGARTALPVVSNSEAPPQFGSESQAQIQSELDSLREAQTARQRVWWVGALALLILVAAVVTIAWLRRPQPGLEAGYERLGKWGRRLGRPAGAGETAGEFGRGLSGRVKAIDALRGAAAAAGVLAYVERFEAAQYSPSPEAAAEEARHRWPRLARELRAIWLRRLAGRAKPPSGE